MKIFKIIALALLISTVGLATTFAQAKGSNTRWRLVNGPATGIVLQGSGNSINDLRWQASGFVGTGPECDCSSHYHGSLQGKEDPNQEGCGWGCVVQEPGDSGQALGLLQNAISQGTSTNAALSNKLSSILNTADVARQNDCSTLFESALHAFLDELLGASANGQITEEDATDIITAGLDYVMLGLDDSAAPFPEPPPPPKDCKVTLMRRHGSGPQTKLFNTKRKVNAEIGDVTVLDAEGCPEGGTYEWDYKFKGQAPGDVPSGAGISFTQQRFCALSQRPTTVTVTVTYHCPDGKKVKDTATINIQ